MTVAVIGDVGGQRRCLAGALRSLGADTGRFELPEGLTVVQVGDLVGAWRDDLRVVEDVGRWMDCNPGRWVQLVGNWELGVLEGRYLWRSNRKEEPPDPDPHLVETLAGWVASGAMVVSVGVASRSGGAALVTHAGLTRSMWERTCAGLVDVGECAARLNSFGLRAGSPVVRPGEMNGPSFGDPGPLWASCREVWSSWCGEGPMPFHQVHGHTSGFMWGKGAWYDGYAGDLVGHVTPKQECRHVWFAEGDKRIVGIDPGLWPRSKPGDLHPLILRGGVVVNRDAVAV